MVRDVFDTCDPHVHMQRLGPCDTSMAARIRAVLTACTMRT